MLETKTIAITDANSSSSGSGSAETSSCGHPTFGRRDAGYDHPAECLETAQERQTKLLGLSIADREVILSVLVDPPEQLCELRAVLLQEHASRQREAFSMERREKRGGKTPPAATANRLTISPHLTK